MATLISRLGDSLDSIAFSWLVYHLTGDMLLTSLMLVVNALPNVLFTLAGGVIADRLKLRTTVVVADSLRCLLVVAVAILVKLSICPIWMLYVFMALISTIEAFSAPSVSKLPAALMDDPSQMTTFAALHQTIQTTAELLGYALAGLVIAFVGIWGTMLLDAATFVLSASLLFSACKDRPAALKADSKSKDRGLRPGGSGVRYALEGVGYLRGQKVLLYLCLYGGFINLILAPFNALNVVYVSVTLQGTPAMLGYLSVGFMSGMIISGLCVPILQSRLSSTRQMTLGNVLLGIGYAMLFLPHILLPSWRLPVAVAANVIAGVGIPQASAIVRGTLLMRVPNDMLGRVMALSLLLSYAATPLGAALGGLVGEYLSLPILFGLCGLAVLLSALPAALSPVFAALNQQTSEKMEQSSA